MEKIEKLEEFNWVSGRDAITIALCNTIIRKQNEIIDHLNSQDQAGVFTEFTDKNISDDIPKGFVDIDGKLYKFEYTPEEWKEVNKDIWYMVGGKKYVNIKKIFELIGLEYEVDYIENRGVISRKS